MYKIPRIYFNITELAEMLTKTNACINIWLFVLIEIKSFVTQHWITAACESEFVDKLISKYYMHEIYWYYIWINGNL